jgi:hypothetical protein
MDFVWTDGLARGHGVPFDGALPGGKAETRRDGKKKDFCDPQYASYTTGRHRPEKEQRRHAGARQALDEAERLRINCRERGRFTHELRVEPLQVELISPALP